MTTTTTYKLSDEVIGQIAKLLQLAMLTGTHIVDHFRQLELSVSEENPQTLVLSEAYVQMHEQHVQALLEDAQRLQAEEDNSLLS